MRLSLVALTIIMATAVACTAEPPATPSPVLDEDPRLRCLREHPAPPAYEPVVRALCAELGGLHGISASVAIAVDDQLVFSTAVGPRCRGRPEPLHPTTMVGIGSITKMVTAALALAIAEREGIGLDDRLTTGPPDLSPAPTLRGLLTHTEGLRDADPAAMLSRGDAWPAVVAEHRVAPGSHAYANANYLLVGRVLEGLTGESFTELYAREPGLDSLREHVHFAPGPAISIACGHRSGAGWEPIEPTAVSPLPAWTQPAGGGLASAEQLVRVPAALSRTGRLPAMIEARVPSDRPGWDYGLGVRVRGDGDDLVLAHSGDTGTYWSELQWSPSTGVAVAVQSTTPQALKATLHAAFSAGQAQAQAR